MEDRSKWSSRWGDTSSWDAATQEGRAQMLLHRVHKAAAHLSGSGVPLSTVLGRVTQHWGPERGKYRWMATRGYENDAGQQFPIHGYGVCDSFIEAVARACDHMWGHPETDGRGPTGVKVWTQEPDELVFSHEIHTDWTAEISAQALARAVWSDHAEAA